MSDAQIPHSFNPKAAPRGPRWLAPVPIALAIGLLLVLILVVWLIARRSSSETEVEPIVEVAVTPVQRAEVREYVEGGGTLNALPGREASFSAATAGKVTHVLVQVGQHVSAGQVLAQLDRTVLAAQVRQAQAALLQARATAVQARTVSGAPSQTLASDQISGLVMTINETRNVHGLVIRFQPTTVLAPLGAKCL